MDLNTKLHLNNKTILNNRIVVPPMASQTANKRGFVTQETLNHYKRLTLSRAALLMLEYTFIHPSGRSEENQLGISSDDHIQGLSTLVNIIESANSIPAIQLTHAGGKTSRNLTDGSMISPSAIKVPTKENNLDTPDLASVNQINLMKKSFVESAIRAHKAGFKVIELHSAHGYGLNQWLSPLTNKRNDLYGGDLISRSRLIVEIIDEIRLNLPHIILSVRVPGMDHFQGGFSINESIELSKILEAHGVDIINVSSGLGGWRRPRQRRGEGYLVDDAKLIQQAINIPVIGVGGIKTKDYINKSLNEGFFSLAAIGRAILNNPNWGNEVGVS